MNITNKIRILIKIYVHSETARFNQYKSMIEAGYTEKMALKKAYKYFNDPDIKALIEEEMESVVANAEVSAEYIKNKMLGIIEFGTKKRKIKKTSKDGESTYEVEELNDAQSAINAAKLLSTALPDFKEKHEHSIQEDQVFEIGGKVIKF